MPPARPSRSLARLTLSAVAVVALAAGAIGCSADEDVDRADFEEKLIERTKLPEAVAGCVTDRVYEQFHQGQINNIVQAATVEELPPGTVEPLKVINRECFEANPG